MDLDTVTDICDARDAGPWRRGDAWLAGGTYLFSEPQPHLTRLRDLHDTGWTPLQMTAEGLEIAATCTIAQLNAFAAARPELGALVDRCCRAFVASFKVQNVATVGGNIVNALPAGPMITLTAALDGVATLVATDGGRRRVPVADLVVGPGTTALREGELLRSITLPHSALRGPTAVRQASLQPHGRSAALLVGRREARGLVLTVTASVPRPVVLRFDTVPGATGVGRAVDDAVPVWFDDQHGRPDWRRHMTVALAEEIRRELGGAA